MVFRAVSMSGDPVASATSAASDQLPRWQTEFRSIKTQHAKRVFQLAVVAFRGKQSALSYDLVREVVELDPDHGAARAVLGYSRRGDRWVTPYAGQRLTSGQVWDGRFGWLPKTQLERFEAGERLWKGQWLPEADVAERRKAWTNAWDIETEHYLVRTNVSLEAGVTLAEHLEQLYSIFFRLFAGYFTPREQIAALFENADRRLGVGGDSRRRAVTRFRVHFYRDRADYLAVLRPHVRSGLDSSTGMYVPKTKTCYFFSTTGQLRPGDLATVMHEATHQLFVETRPKLDFLSTQGNYFAVEGISSYMESLTRNGDWLELGDWNTPRLALGRRRVLSQNQYVPLERLVQLGATDFFGAGVSPLYTESACICRYFMHADGGRHRDAFVEYLEAVYTGKADTTTLAAVFGVSLEELDARIREHIEQGQ